jgi:predicted nucleotidyltransferase component of viral defense system
MSDVDTVFREMTTSPDLFHEFIDYTARKTGFRRELVEKDFFCSVILDFMSTQLSTAVVFRGGTCLSKVYTDFSRLSEDLDFTIPSATVTHRGGRRRRIESVRKMCEEMMKGLPTIHEIKALRGSNESTQYSGIWGYQSIVSGETERIQLDFGLREPILLPAEDRQAGTLLLNAVTGAKLVAPFHLHVMALAEVWAEKTRAALTRLRPAIRDFFDLDHALLNQQVDFEDNGLRELVQRKLAVPGNGPVDLSAVRKAELERQIPGQLRPVLRLHDFERFSLERIWSPLVTLASRLQNEQR